MISRVQNFIECRMSNAKTWYMHHLIQESLQPAGIVMDIGSGNAPTPPWIPHTMIYRIDPMIIPSYDKLDIVGTWSDAVEHMKIKHIDYVVLLDVIEHIHKQEALALVKETQKYVSRIVVFTPRGFMPQDDGVWNTHRSGWDVDDFRGCDGWMTYVIPGFHMVDFRGMRLEKSFDAVVAVWFKYGSEA